MTNILPPIPPQPTNLLILFSPQQWHWLSQAFDAIRDSLVILNIQGETLMADLTGLNQAVADFKTEVATHATKIDTELAQLLAAQGSGDQAGIDAAAQSIRDQTSALQALDVQLDADDTPAA